MDISLDNNADSSHTVKRNLDVLVVAPVAHACHVDAVRLVFLVSLNHVSILKSLIRQSVHTLCEYNVRAKRCCELATSL